MEMLMARRLMCLRLFSLCSLARRYEKSQEKGHPP